MQDPSEKKNHADDIAISDRDMEVTPSTPEASQQVKVFRPKETQSLEFNKTEDNNGGNHP